MNQSLSKKQRKKLKLKQKQEQAQKQAKGVKNPTSSLKNQEPKAHQNEKREEKRKLSEQKVQIKEKKQKNKKQKKLQNKNQEEKESSNQQQEIGYEDLDFNQIQQGQQNEQFSFLISEINEKHYHSMKTILQKFSRVTGIMSSEWADAIIGNGKAGNVVVADDQEQEQDEDQENEQESQDQNQQDDQENVCSGVINILPFNHKLSKKIVEKVLKSYENKKNKTKGKSCSELVKNNNCSLLICERAINLPPFIVQSMHQVLVKDLEQLGKSNKTQYQKICSNYIVSMSEVQIPKQQKRQDLDIQELIYSKFQDYLFVKNSAAWWVGEGSPNSVRKVPLHKLYYIISVKKYFQSVGLIHTLLNQ